MIQVPNILLIVSENSTLRLLQDPGVRVNFIDLRVEQDVVSILPERDQTLEIDAFLRRRAFASLGEDLAGTAANAFAQLVRQRLIVGTLEPQEAQP